MMFYLISKDGIHALSKRWDLRIKILDDLTASLLPSSVILPINFQIPLFSFDLTPDRYCRIVLGPTTTLLANRVDPIISTRVFHVHHYFRRRNHGITKDPFVSVDSQMSIGICYGLGYKTVSFIRTVQSNGVEIRLPEFPVTVYLNKNCLN